MVVLCSETSFLPASYTKESGVAFNCIALRVTCRILSSRRGEGLVNICAFVSTFEVDFLDSRKFNICQAMTATEIIVAV